MKVAIVYDWLDKWGGVERLLLVLHEMYPQAEWYTSYYDKKNASWAKDLKIQTSFIQKLPGFIRSSRILSLLFYPHAFESFNFNGYDVVISVTSSFAKGIITKPDTKHICYMLTPTRYLWGMSDQYITGWKRVLASPLLEKLRKWDYIAATRPDTIISLSKTVAYRAETYYKRMSEVLYPPFDIGHWETVKKNIKKPAFITNEENEYYLVVSRLEPYKRVDLPIQLFNKTKKKLVVVGRGSKEQELRRISSSNITFVSNLSDEELGYLYTHAKATIIPQEEDFGYVSLEAQFFGSPVVAYNRGGVPETLSSNPRNILFAEQSVISLQEALATLEVVAYNGGNSAGLTSKFFEQFSKKNFIDKLNRYIIP
jgi:glycosyltransferase involved in cell wall biosynthesis